MIELSESDFRPLETFSLAWRWTDSRRTLLPPDALANIRPLRVAKAAEIFERTPAFHPDKGFVSELYQPVDQIDASAQDTDQVARWLRHYLTDETERIVVSWDQQDAVLTNVGVFCAYWDDFCYPSSDDVDIFPLTEEWILYYWHEEVLFLGHRRPGS
jgi:hypothetical protein